MINSIIQWAYSDPAAAFTLALALPYVASLIYIQISKGK